MKCLFLMDPLEGINFEKDTTLSLMIECCDRGHEVHYVPKDGISVVDGRVIFHAIRVTAVNIPHQPFKKEHAARLTQDDVHMVFVRPDPPFDEQYLHNTWVLDLLPKNVIVINSPQGIRSVNEKIWSSRFTDFVPPTIISANPLELMAFVSTHKDIIAKPTNAFGGQSVFHIEPGSTNTRVILETLSGGYSKPIILQRYIPEAASGDKRILLLGADVLGVLLRVHAQGEHRNNFYAGGKPAPTELNNRDREIIAALKPHLLSLGLHFVGIDMLGDRLIEVNVTSPTCLQEMNRLYNVRLQERVIDHAERMVRAAGQRSGL